MKLDALATVAGALPFFDLPLLVRLRRVNQPTMPFAETTKPEVSPSRPIDGAREREEQG